MSIKRWIILSKALKVAGLVAFLACFTASLLIAQYANFTRPHNPNSEKGWTERIPWSYGAYGTPRESTRLRWFFTCGFYCIVLIVFGEAINIYKLGNNPPSAPTRKVKAKF
ncbi:MAG TPA: hypothetical protein VE422_10285 [Terriglobia bacterium]|nr:hypothetical protein [Terriglobia bacterium]